MSIVSCVGMKIYQYIFIVVIKGLIDLAKQADKWESVVPQNRKSLIRKAGRQQHINLYALIKQSWSYESPVRPC